MSKRIYKGEGKVNIGKKKAEKSTLESILYHAIKHIMREYTNEYYMYTIKFNDFFGAFLSAKNELLKNSYFKDLQNSYFLDYEDVLGMYIDLLVEDVRKDIINLDRAIIDKNEIHDLVNNYLSSQLIGDKVSIKPFLKNSELKNKHKHDDKDEIEDNSDVVSSMVDIAIKVAENKDLNDYEKDEQLRKIGVRLSDMQTLGFGVEEMKIQNKVIDDE